MTAPNNNTDGDGLHIDLLVEGEEEEMPECITMHLSRNPNNEDCADLTFLSGNMVTSVGGFTARALQQMAAFLEEYAQRMDYTLTPERMEVQRDDGLDLPF